MKYTRLGGFLGAVALAAAAISVLAQAATPAYRLAWDDGNPAGTVGTYKVYEVTGPDTAPVYTLLATTTTKEWPIGNLTPGAHKLTVQAVGLAGGAYDGVVSPYSTNKVFGVLIAVVNLTIKQ